MGRLEVVLEGMASWIPPSDSLVGPTAIGGNAPQYDWSEVCSPVAGGARGAIRYAFAPRWWVEVRGAWYGTANGDDTQRGVFGFRPGLGGPDSPLASQPAIGALTTETRAYGGELNVQRGVACCGDFEADVLFGGRYFRFEEDARIDLDAGTSPNFRGPAFAASGATSQFAGLQVGGVLRWRVARRLELLGTLKALGGWARREVDVSDRSIFAGGSHAATASDDDMTWGGEVELGFRWHVKRHISITGGYNLLALDGMQRAADAMDFTQSTSGAVQARIQDDVLLLHSIFLGLTLDF